MTQDVQGYKRSFMGHILQNAATEYDSTLTGVECALHLRMATFAPDQLSLSSLLISFHPSFLHFHFFSPTPFGRKQSNKHTVRPSLRGTWGAQSASPLRIVAIPARALFFRVNDAVADAICLKRNQMKPSINHSAQPRTNLEIEEEGERERESTVTI